MTVLQDIIAHVKGKNEHLLSTQFQIQKQRIISHCFPLRIHSAWEESIAQCYFQHSSHRCSLTESSMNTKLSSERQKKKPKEMRKKITSEAFRVSLWQEQNES